MRVKLWLKLCNTEAEHKNRVAYKSVHYIKGGWVPVGRKKLLNGIEMGWVPLDWREKMQKYVKMGGWVYFTAKQLFSAYVPQFFSWPPPGIVKILTFSGLSLRPLVEHQ